MARHLAPAGTPIGVRDIARWSGSLLDGESPVAAVESLVRRRFGVAHATMVSTGRAAMTLLLQAMHRLRGDGRREVVLPGYTCYSVAASVMKAGLVPRVLDISPATLDYTDTAWDQVDWTQTLAVVATNLYGYPSRVSVLADEAARHGVFVIDDAAQAMGATIGGRACGTFGDAGLFSFDKGKNVAAVDGGVLVVHESSLAEAIARSTRELPAESLSQRLVHVGKVLAYAAFLRPELYGVPARMPQLGLGRTEFTTAYPMTRPDPGLAALALVMLDHLDELTAARSANAAAWHDALASHPGLSFVEPADLARPAYLRFPILIDDPARRDACVSRLVAAGIGATASYPQALPDVPELAGTERRDTPVSGARFVAARILTLPTHPYVTRADIDRGARVLGTLQ